MSTVVTKRALKTFERPPFLKGWKGEVDKLEIREAPHLWETHKTLAGELNVAFNLWGKAYQNSSQHGNEKDEIVCEDSRAKFIDSFEKLSYPCPYTKQYMYGRDKEVQDIKAQLLKQENRTLSFTVICGDPGMGKTMLAQCLFDDTEVSNAFNDAEVVNSFNLRDWINCHDIEATINDNNDDTCINTIHTIMRKLFVENRLENPALLVFDGWRPKFDYKHFYEALLRLEDSDRPTCIKIIVTTTYISPLDTSVASYPNEYDVLPPTCVQLLGLSIEESRYMFESLAFSPNVSSEEKTRIIDSEIGSKTLNLCSANPCVINTVASILSTKSTIDEWVHFVDVVWTSIPFPLKMITSTFNLVAFKRLPFPIKRCLLFCSLFPKDYEFSRVDLNLWLARELKFENDVKPLDVELIGDEYLQMLHKIGYFVEHGKDEDGTLTYKMPIFSYEFLKFITRLDYNEYQSGGTGMYHVDPTTIRHVSFIVDDASWRPPTWLREAKKLQSVLFLGKHCESLTGLEDIIASLKYLQILGGDISERLLSETGEFEHLRSLKVRSTDQKLLKKIITRTRNLRLLDLGHLIDVHVLPKELHNLQCLRHLYVRFKLNNQASPNSGELLSLSKFNVFMTGQDNNLTTLVDYNNIVDNEMMDYEEWNETLRDNKTQNTALCWQSPNHRKDDIVVKTLELPESLENVTVRYWNGLTVPRFRGLVSLQIMDCHECQRIPSFSRLPKLKSFKLWNLDALEYIENVDCREDEPYFESLRSLVLGNLPKVKAWNENDIPKMKIIPHLTEIQISSTKLEHLPLFVETIVSLEVKDISVQLLRSLFTSEHQRATAVRESTTAMLKRLSVSAVHGLERMWIEFPMFESLIIRQCHQLTKLDLEKCSNFWSLQLHECSKLRKLWFPQQAKLGEIEIHGCEELDLQKIGTLIPRKNHLRKLTLVNFKHLESLPSGLDSFTLLETISISWIYNLKELPEGIGRLENLRRVVVQNCPRLITIPESLGHLMNVSTALEVKFRSCRALRQLPESFPRNQPSRLIIKECPKLERSMSYVGSV